MNFLTQLINIFFLVDYLLLGLSTYSIKKVIKLYRALTAILFMLKNIYYN